MTVANPQIPIKVAQAGPFTLLGSSPNTIVSYNIPNDGQTHRISFQALLVVSVGTTGGQINGAGTIQGNSITPQVIAGTQASTITGSSEKVCDPGTVASMVQATTLTGGAAVAYCWIYDFGP